MSSDNFQKKNTDLDYFS